jgi:hypothetical protein
LQVNVNDEISPKKNLAKKGMNIPNLNLGKVIEKVDKNHSYSERNNMSSSIGFKSERSIKKADITGSPDSTDRTPTKAKINKTADNGNGINFFFYKNFNKFIQNLYIQDEQLIKKKLLSEKHIEPTNIPFNPYRKEIDSSHSKKIIPIKKSNNNMDTLTTNLAQNRVSPKNSNLPKNGSAKKLFVFDDDRKVKGKDDFMSSFLKEGTSSTKSAKGLNKSSSIKHGLNIEFNKMKFDGPEVKTFYTPREFKF